MSTLFDTDDGDTIAPPQLATPKQVRLLEGYYYRTEAVRLWTKEKAETVLRNCQREERIALQRAATAAAQIEAPEKRSQPSTVERLTAAAYLEQSRACGADELVQAVAYSLYVCTDDEVRRLAGYLVKLWRTTVDRPGTAGGTDGDRSRDDADERRAASEPPEDD